MMTTIEKIEKGIIALAEFTEDQQTFIRGVVKLSFNEGLEQALRIHDVDGSLPLADLEKRLNEVLDKETPETLNKWLEENRK